MSEIMDYEIAETEEITDSRKEFLEKLKSKIEVVPLSEEVMNDIMNVATVFYNQGHSGTSANYTLNSAFYFLTNNIADKDEIMNTLMKCVDDDEDATEEDKSVQQLIANNIYSLVEAVNGFLAKHNYSAFYLNLFRRILYQKPILDVVTFEDDMWEDTNYDSEEDPNTKIYQHKRASKIFKAVDTETNEKSIYQIDYFIFEDFKNDLAYTSSNSHIDISDCYSWSETSIDIDMDTVQKFVIEFNEQGVLFDQSKYDEFVKQNEEE